MVSIPLESEIEWDNKLNTIAGKKLLRGVTDVLKTTFYPCYSYRKATNGPITKQQDPMRNKLHNIYFGPKGLKGGINLDDMVERYHKYNIITEDAVMKSFIRILDGRTIEACQFPVMIGDLNLCTCVDLILRVGKRRLLLVELKTGYGKYKYRHTGNNMKFPFDYLDDSPINQHKLQMMIGQKMFQKMYPQFNVSCEIWYVSPYRLDNLVVEVDLKMLLRGSKMLVELEKTKFLRRKARTRLKSNAKRRWKRRKLS